jgi:HAD superfamily hydrolase (TIGR01509 family)
MTLKAILFDVDGTLAETEETHRRAFNGAFAELGLPFTWDEEEYEALLRVGGGKERLAHYFAGLDVAQQERDRLSRLVSSVHEVKTRLYAELAAREGWSLRPGVARLIDEAEAAGILLGIASTTTAVNVTVLIERALGAGSMNRFAVVACGDVVKAKKPAPDIYRYALASLGLEAAEVVAFEDSEIGLAAAKGAGLLTVVTPSRWTRRDRFAAADLTLPHLGEPNVPLEGEDAVRAGGPFLTLNRLETLRAAALADLGVGASSPSRWLDPLLAGRADSLESTRMLASLFDGIRLACGRVSAMLEEHTRSSGSDARGAALDIFLRAVERTEGLAAVAFEGGDGGRAISFPTPRRGFLLALEPLELGASAQENLAVGSIFSLLRAPEGSTEPTENDFLRPGVEQIAAGYALYGPATVLVLTAGEGVRGFRLARARGELVPIHSPLGVPDATQTIAVNTSHGRSWGPPVRRYVNECVKGAAGPRGRDVQLRWGGSAVAEVHGVLVRGGVVVCPTDTGGQGGGGLHLTYAANPLAMLVERAGGAASTGLRPILGVMPRTLDERVPAVLGSREEVERLERYHREHEAGLDAEFTSPLFNERSLFPSR